MNEEKWYLNITYPELKDIILESIANMTREFVAVGYYLKYVRDHEMYLADGYASIWEFAEDLYGIQRSTCSRWMAINDRFSVQGNSPVLDDRYRQYGKSQLQEMLYLDDKQIEEVKPEMTVKEIREIRKPEPVPEVVEVAEIREPDPVEQIPGQMSVEDYPEILLDEEQEDGPKKCITGKSGSGICGAAAYCTENHDCCVQCDQDCNSRCGWLNDVCDVAHDETVEPVADVVIESSSEEEANPVELYEETSDKSDLDIAREENRKAQSYLEMAKKEFGPNDIRVRKQKILVAALAGYICEVDAIENPPEEPEQPELPKLKNNTQREEWLNNYRDWGLWYYDDHIDVNYYKYDFADGSRLVVAEYPQRECEWSSEKRDEHYYHLIQENRKGYGSRTYNCKYTNSTDSKTYLIEFLKNLQKGEK